MKRPPMTRHLASVDPGVAHRRRWAASCSCGMWSTHRCRSRAEAYRRHRLHLARMVGHHAAGYKPRPPTPIDQLPDELVLPVALLALRSAS